MLTTLLFKCHLHTLFLLPGLAFSQGVGTNYCTTSPNSAGAGAVISASGSNQVALNNLLLQADALPTGQFGMFFYGPNQVSNPFGNGVVCVGGALHRLSPATFSGGTGVITYALDLSAPPTAGGAIFAGSTWNFQAWYRDGVAGGAGYNFSDGLEVQFASGAPPYAGMALVPGGLFSMGRHVGSGPAHELPLHDVLLSAYFMDIEEVTNQKYAHYLNLDLAAGLVAVSSSGVVLQAGGAGQVLCDTTSISSESRITWNGLNFGVTSGKETHPMSRISWYGAGAYCNWRSRFDGLGPCYNETSWVCDFLASGYRLATEAEWEFAARGGQLTPYERYPWGNSIDGSNANYFSSGDPFDNGTTPAGYFDGNQTPAGADMANGFGLYDMSGNVWEWCGDWYGPYSGAASVNPTGPAAGTSRLFRGGGWQSVSVGLRSAYRGFIDPALRYSTIGFRVVAPRP